MFVTIYICTINLFLLFDNTTGMTHLKTDFEPSYRARSLPSADRNSTTELHHKKITANIFIESKNSLKEIVFLIPIKLESAT